MVEYGTIGIRPMGEWDPDIKYGLLNLVTLDGSSYVAHTEPPIGTLPTNVAYWQASAQGTGKATAGSVGTVKPDGVTTEVDGNGALSVKTANQSTAGIVKGSASIKVGESGIIDVDTIFEQATELANIIAGEAIASVFGKISKSIAVTMGLDQNALLKNMLTNIDANDQNKIPTSAFVHNLYERIGMGEDLDIGDNLTAVVKALNNDLTNLSNGLALADISSSFAINNTYVLSLSAYKFGKVVFLSGTLTTNIPTGSIANIATIATVSNAAYRPIVYAAGSDATTGATADVNNKVNIMLSPDGTIKAIAATALGAAKRFSAVYFIA